jgi:hypothetical protein
MITITHKFIVVIALITTTFSFCQVGIGTTTPNADALLEINSTVATPGGVLLPRMALTMTTNPAPLSADVAGMIVYNTATAGDVTPGFYYNDGAIWIKLGAGAASADWSILGNGGTTYSTNFLGTTDGTDLAIKRNNTTKIRVENAQITFADEIRTRDGGTDAGDELVHIYDSNDDGVIEVNEDNAMNHRIHGNGTTIFNEQGLDLDFRIEGVTNSNVLYIDAGNNVVGVNDMPTAPFVLGIAPNTVSYPMEIGSDGATGSQVAMAYYRTADVTINPEDSGTGYVGYYNNPPGPGVDDDAWGDMYSYNYNAPSSEEIKRNINVINENKSLENYVSHEIMKLKPSFYNYHNEDDKLVKGNENHYRPAFRLGLIADETPDYMLSRNLSAVDIYAVGTIAIAGVQNNMKKISELKQNEITQDFGSKSLSNEQKIWITFNENFKTIPVITLTSNKNDTTLSIIKKTNKGFEVQASKITENLQFDWIALAKNRVKSNNTKGISTSLPPHLKNKLEIPEGEKTTIINHYKNLKSTMEYNGPKK